MISTNPILGTGLHSIGGMSAASCYMPFEKVKNWSWGVFWIIQSIFAWLIMPLLIGYLTVPDLYTVIISSPPAALWSAFLLGAVYGFGGLSFGYAIRNIGYSLTYTISIGISAVLGTIIPLIIKGELVEQFSKNGGGIVLLGMTVSILGVAMCGRAGFLKEQNISQSQSTSAFNMKKGLLLTIIAGALSAVWGLSLELGQPISDIAAQHGAGHFEGNAKLIVSSLGCLLTNLCWFINSTIKDGSIKALFNIKEIGKARYSKNFILSIMAGSMWYFQFFFYGLGHVRMGNFQFASWVLHMSMLIFFSYIIGVIMKEWKGVNKKTYTLLIIALCVLVSSFVIMTYGSYIGELNSQH
ncbi:L-rhamnose/proton symporter RhaT [Saccharicrinis fermentans]|uniref:L-rhamnose-H(+) transport protein n=1 Tax=Saccharicrinis fermentans DSM 9555 = JCM 21142 TaxID=869213 RepID=W7YGE8_9BACT|nr:L-rhamnose/proton symporter RhaT [Saccharicrinis fermentans]GAF03501.1 L-rhamnose-H(+) transport protein [Saccharicrinis fermentans DSM 9555 = JCM 21142]